MTAVPSPLVSNGEQSGFRPNPCVGGKEENSGNFRLVTFVRAICKICYGRFFLSHPDTEKDRRSFRGKRMLLQNGFPHRAVFLRRSPADDP